MNLRGPGNESRSLTVFYDKEQQITLPLAPQEGGATGTPGAKPITDYVPITFHWTAPGKPDTIVTPISTPGGMQVSPVSPSNIAAIYFTTHAASSSRQLADFYSTLSKQNKESEFVAALKEQFPQITSLSNETEAGTNMLFVSVPWIDRKIPLALLSHGANHVAGLLLCIAQVPRGIICVDEIESGLFHARFKKMWSQVASFAEKYQTQVFASTHSQECLDAATASLNPDQFALIQTSRTNGNLSARVIDGTDAALAIKHDLEVRG